MTAVPPTSGEALADLLADVIAAVEDDLAHGAGTPDFAAVVALAHRLDAQVVPVAAVDEVAGWAPVVPIGAGRRRRTRDDPAFAAVLADVRAHIEQPAAAPSGNNVVVLPAVPRRRWALAGALAAAAGLVLAVGAWGVAARLQGGEAVPLQSAHGWTAEPGEASSITPPERGADARAEDPIVLPPTSPGAPPEVTPEEPAPAPIVPDAFDEPATPSPRSEKARAVPLSELDAQAQAAWKAGDLETADALYREIVRRAGRSTLADIAFNERFQIARQAGAPAREAKLWRQYLQRFPAGRFAEDARAGLCRRAQGQARRTCWRDYLDAHPKGMHRARAERELAEEPSP